MSATGMLTGSTLVMLPLAAVVEGPLPIDLSLRTWGAIGYYSLVSTAWAYLLYYAILKRAGAGTLLVVTLMIPPVAIFLGAWVRGEMLGPEAYAGFALLALGLAILGGRPRNVARKSPAA
jgi:drug/metabolite transporter (DMT)-like permease